MSIRITVSPGGVLRAAGDAALEQAFASGSGAGLLALLKEDGEILIGDVAFRTRVELEACKTQAGASWDEDEIYFVADELAPAFPQLKFVPFSACAGILSLRR